MLQVTETASSLGMSEEEFKQHSRMKRLEAEAQEEVWKKWASKVFNSFSVSKGATDACCTARGKDEEASPTSTSSTKGFCLIDVIFCFLKVSIS